MQIGEKIHSFDFTATSGIKSSLDAYQGKRIILYFYPKDSTPGCTLEGQDFRDAYTQFKALNAEIFGISRDSLKSHENFKCKQAFPFDLISDENEFLCQLFDVIKMKSMYGKKVRGIERSTFILDSNLVLQKEWRKVSVKGHVAEVLAYLESMQEN